MESRVSGRSLAQISKRQDIKLVDLRRNPTYVVLDLGCTRAMGSRRAVEAFAAEASWVETDETGGQSSMLWTI